MAEGGAETVIDEHGDDEREACHAKGEVVRLVYGGSPVVLRVVHDFHGCRWGEQRAQVDGHIEDAKCRVSLGGVGGVIVEIAHHHLQVTLKQSRSHADDQQSGGH